MRISYSALNTFLECPHKYKLLYIDKIKFPQSIELVFGQLIHKTLKFLYDSSQLPSLDELLSYYKENWPKKEDYNWESEETEQQYFALGVAMLSDFYRGNIKDKDKIIDQESRFQIPLTDHSGETHILTGVIDRIDKTTKGFEVIDYKTNKIIPPPSISHKSLQLSIYRLALKQRWPNLKPQDVDLTLYYLKTGDRFTSTRSEVDLIEVKNFILSTIEEIKTSDFMPTSTRFCKYLPYRLTCPAWLNLYKKEKTIEDQKIDELINRFFKIKDNIKKEDEELEEIKNQISSYMDKEKILRVFGDEGYFTKNIRKIFNYDLEPLKLELEKLGLWNKVLSFDEKKLTKLLETFPESTKDKILKTRKLTKETVSLKALKIKKGKHF